MNKKTEDEARELAENHWDWLESVLLQQMQVTKKLFIDGFIHGFGHESKKKERRIK